MIPMEPETFKFNRQEFFIYKHAEYAAQVCHAVKEGNIDACYAAARFLAKQIHSDCTLIPAPQHVSGRAEYTNTICIFIQDLVKTRHRVQIADVLRCTPHESLYAQKQKDPNSKLELNFFIDGIVPESHCLFVDNVYDTGITFQSARRIIPGLLPLVIAVNPSSIDQFKNLFPKHIRNDLSR